MKLIIYKKGKNKLKSNDIVLRWVFTNFQSIIEYLSINAYTTNEYDRIIIEENNHKYEEFCLWMIDSNNRIKKLNEKQIKKLKSKFININNVFNLTEI